MKAWMRWVLASIVVALAGCTEDKPDEGVAPECGSLASFDLSGCDLGSLGAVDRAGVWNANLTGQNFSFAAAFSLLSPEQPLLHGRPATLDASGDRFYLRGEPVTVQTRSGEQTYFYAYAACQASGPQAMTGKFMRCTDGNQTLAGNFEAKRVQRIAGEGEASGITLLSETAMPDEGEAADVFVANGHAYIPGFEKGLWVVNVQNRAAPSVVAHIAPPEPDYWNGAWVVGNALYVASARKGVLVYDVTTPSSPVAVTSVPADESINVHTLFVDGATLYAMSPGPTGETLIFDVAQPTAPALLSRFKSSDAAPREDRHPHDATVFDGKLYVNHWASGLVIADVSDPSSPKELGRFSYEDATSHASQVGVINGRTIVFEGGEDWGAHLRVIDATDAANPKQIGAFKLRDEVSLHNMQLVGTTLYVAWYHDGLRALDVSTPESPTQIAWFNTWRETDPRRGLSFYDGAIGIRTPGDGFIYVTDLSRGLLIFPEP